MWKQCAAFFFFVILRLSHTLNEVGGFASVVRPDVKFGITVTAKVS